MSQVDYLHFFNDIIWNFVQLILMYIIISVLYVQSFYKVFRLRLCIYKNFSNFILNQDYAINKNFDVFKKKCLKYFKYLKKKTNFKKPKNSKNPNLKSTNKKAIN